MFILTSCTNSSTKISGRDDYGCLSVSGYEWCPSKQKCLRMEEEYCNEYAEKFDFKAEDLVLKMSDMEGGYDLIDEHKVSIDEGTENVVAINRQSGLKSKYLVEFKSDTLLNSEESQIKIVQLVQVFSNEGIDIFWNYTKKDIQTVVNSTKAESSAEDGFSLRWTYFDAPIIGDNSLAVFRENNRSYIVDLKKQWVYTNGRKTEFPSIPIYEIISDKYYSLIYKYRDIFVKITVSGNESNEEKAIMFANLSLNKIKNYEATLNE